MFFYRMITSLLALLIYPYGRLRVAFGSELWRGRLGLVNLIGQKDIWIHASSVGEVKVARTLIDALLRREPELAIHLSVMTEAGNSTAHSLVGDTCTVSFLPLDADWLVRRMFRRLAPKVLVIAETEIWPNLISRADSLGVKVVLVNGRMSAKSFENYRLFKRLSATIMSKYDFCFFKSEADLNRFRVLGLPQERGRTGGDMKFDSIIKPISQAERAVIRQRFSLTKDDFLWVAGSTRPGERDETGEEQLLGAIYKRLVKQHPRLKLIIVPRHLQRLPTIIQWFERLELPVLVVENDRDKIDLSGGRIAIINYMGGLVQLYQAADLSFVGGTLVPLGGHNLLEPVWAGSPVVFGQHVDNVSEAADFIAERNLGAMAVSAEALSEKVSAMLSGELKFTSAEGNLAQDSATGRAANYILDQV